MPTITYSEPSTRDTQRAYSVIEIKAISDEQRIIEGMATTPEPDRLGDIVEPLGVEFKNPLPLLWQHKSDQPVGQATFKKPTKEGIRFTAKFARIEEPGRLKDRIDEAWQSVKAGLVRAVSIGFRAIELSFMDDGGIRFINTEVMELSLVTIPANVGATIENIKSIDTASRAASGNSGCSEDTNPPGVTGQSKPRERALRPSQVEAIKRAIAKSLAPKEARKMSKQMTFAEQIAAFENKRSANVARMTELMNKAAEAGETLDETESPEYDGLEVEVKKIDEHLRRLRPLEEANKAAAKPIEKAESVAQGSEARGHPVISVRANVPPGTAFIRAFLARAQHDMGWDRRHPADIAKSVAHWHNTPEVERVLRAAVSAGTTTHATWAGPLVEETNLVSEFAELLRAASIIGRIPGLRRVPFNIKVPRQTAGATVNWIGEGKVKPVSEEAFDQITLAHTKVAGIVPITEELLRFSSPSAEEIIRNDLSGAIVALVDRDFLDPTKALASGVSPASITNGVTPVTATGTNADALRADLATMLTNFASENINLGGVVLVMTQTQAINISLMTNTFGQPEFPGMGVNGGTLVGLPVIVSENIVGTGGSPANGTLIVAIAAREVLLADDGQVSIDVSREASLQMDSAPDSPATASTVMVSLWQHNMVGIKAERFINWVKRRAEAVQFINYAKYAA